MDTCNDKRQKVQLDKSGATWRKRMLISFVLSLAISSSSARRATPSFIVATKNNSRRGLQGPKQSPVGRNNDRWLSLGGPIHIRHSERDKSIETIRTAGFFDDVAKFFDELGDGKGDDVNDCSSKNENELGVEKEANFAGSSRVLSIPVKTIKMGSVRLYLFLYLMGYQNTPEKGSWKASQPDDTILDMRFHDLSATLTISLSEKEIAIDRIGSAPSMQYVMHESELLNGILDELNSCVFDGRIEESNRLLTLPEPGDAIEKARDVVAFA